MYQLTVEGNNLEALKIGVRKLYLEMNDEQPVNTSGYSEVIETVAKETLAKEPKEKVEPPRLDTEGIPWDRRIHTGSKAVVKSGRWKQKRNVDQETLANVKAELVAQVYREEHPVATPAAPINATTPVVESPVAAPVVVAAPAVAPAAPARPTMATGNGHTIETFSSQFPMILGTLISERTITQSYVEELKTYFSVQEIWNINAEQKQELFNTFVEYDFIQKVG